MFLSIQKAPTPHLSNKRAASKHLYATAKPEFTAKITRKKLRTMEESHSTISSTLTMLGLDMAIHFSRVVQASLSPTERRQLLEFLDAPPPTSRPSWTRHLETTLNQKLKEFYDAEAQCNRNSNCTRYGITIREFWDGQNVKAESNGTVWLFILSSRPALILRATKAAAKSIPESGNQAKIHFTAD